MVTRNYWKWIYSGVVYRIDVDTNVAEVVIGDKYTKVGATKNLRDLKKPGSDEGRPMKQFFTLNDAINCPNVIL